MIKSKSVKACGVGLTAQINEARKVLCHNRGVVIQSVHELGIETSFRGCANG